MEETTFIVCPVDRIRSPLGTIIPILFGVRVNEGDQTVIKKLDESEWPILLSK